MTDRTLARDSDRDDPADNPLPTRGETRYRLDDQIGFLLRRANQRHLAIFAETMGPGSNGAARNGTEITPMQWAALAKLYERGPSAQTSLGRATAMDAATIKGVVDRLTARGLVEAGSDPADGRRRTIALSPAGRRLVARLLPRAATATEETLAALTPAERQTIRTLLHKLT